MIVAKLNFLQNAYQGQTWNLWEGEYGASFFARSVSQVGVDASTTPTAAAAALQGAGDQMLQAVIFHRDNLELSEQFDATTGYEKSVSNLTWSYASFLSAVRARTAI